MCCYLYLCLLNVHVGLYLYSDVNEPKFLVNSAHFYYILDVICIQVFLNESTQAQPLSWSFVF